MLIDVHAHFYTELSGRGDWEAINRRRLEAGRRAGITAVVASILGTYGRRSPTYFPSPPDVEHANRRMVELTRLHPGSVFGYCVVNPNDTAHALSELRRGVAAGLVGLKLAASRRANDALLDPLMQLAAELAIPVLHHVWQGRQRDWPGQEASNAVELCDLAARHATVPIILAHLGGGGDWAHSLRVVRDVPNVWIDLSGSGVDTDMLHAALDAVGAGRLLWGCDLTVDAGWAKLRYLQSLGLPPADLERIGWRNARALFPTGTFDGH